METSAPTAPVDRFGWVGSLIDGKYLVERVAGSGTFGIVYKAADLGMGTPVAIKCLKLREELADADRKKFLAGLADEGRVLRRLSSLTSGIVQAHDVGAAVSPSGEWCPYLVLEWLDGHTLAEELSEHPGGRALSDAIALLRPAAQALQVVHAEGVAHLDLKPENMSLIGQRPGLKLLDFGVAKLIEDASDLTASTAKTNHAMRAFTPKYGAPEQFVSGQPRGPWTDVYALALVLLEVVSGRPAYSGTRGEMAAEAQDLERRPSFSSLGVDVPESVSRVVRKALAVDIENRFQNAGEFWDALERALNEPIPVRSPSGRSANSTEPASTSRPQDAPRSAVSPESDGRTTSPQLLHETIGGPSGTSQPVRRWRRRAPLLALATTVAVAVTGLVVAGIPRAPSESESAASTMGSSSARPIDMPKYPMVMIPAGDYMVGGDSGNPSRCEAPKRTVHVNAFKMDATEVTVRDYLRCMALGQCSSTKAHAQQQAQWRGPELCNELRAERGEKVDDNPMNCVDRMQAAAYCATLGARLPTDDEWESAARGPRGSTYPWGNDSPTCKLAVYARGEKNPCPGPGPANVATLARSPSGLFDIVGNVWEWTSTSCDRQSAGMGSLRGGGFEWNADQLRAWTRLPFDASSGGVSTGFRCVSDIPQAL